MRTIDFMHGTCRAPSEKFDKSAAKLEFDDHPEHFRERPGKSLPRDHSYVDRR
jgi:hypothetical protein